MSDEENKNVLTEGKEQSKPFSSAETPPIPAVGSTDSRAESINVAESDITDPSKSEGADVKKPAHRWRTFLLIWVAVLLAVGVITWIVLYRYAAVYEATRPEIPMEEMLSSMSKDDWLNMAAPSAENYISEFEDAENLFRSYYESTLKEYDLSYRRSISGSDNTTAAFVVMAKNTSLYNVVFKARDDKRPGFGRHYWKLDSVNVCDFTSNLEHINAEVIAPGDVTISINGIPVSDAYYSEDVPIPGMSELEKRFNPAPTYKRYSIGSMFGSVTVMDEFGRELHPEYDELRGIYTYSYVPEELYSITVKAPEDVRVVINGAELLLQDMTSSSLGIFQDFQNYTLGNEWKTIEYSFSGIYTEPVIQAYDSSGNELVPVITDSGKFLFFHKNDEQLKNEVYDAVDYFFNCYMDYSSSHLAMAKLNALLGCTLYGTRLNKYFRYSADAMYWASNTEVNYDELVFSDFCPVGENAFYCTIQYSANFTAQSWYEENSYEMKNGYEMLFVNNGRNWVAAEMFSFS